ncbi:MAG: heme lyase CcmF/NrfE family subunit [Pseudomonadales bacterium]
MIAELGHFSLILALGLSACLMIIPALGVYQGRSVWMQMGGPLAAGMFVFIAISFACLGAAFLQDDFSVTYVAENSNTRLPDVYKFSAIWGAHEGSFLLWTLVMAGWTLAVSMFSGTLTQDMRARVMAILGGLSLGFILFMLLTSNPFERSLPVAPQEGSDLNPLLQDFGLIVHPPMLYMGYVGFAIPFAFAIAALWSGRLDSAWARWSRPWTNVAWAFLALGITLGSWWAYYELGWGGWWFWDPVENASFMPWLMGTALIHSLAVTEKRGVFRSWTVLLAIFTFSLSLLGAFLVRSGVLTSVHSFAVDPERGLFILAFLLLVVGGSLTLFAFRASGIRNTAAYTATSREMLLLVNNLILVVAAGAVLLGTLYPLIYEAVTGGDKISVGPPYFNTVFVPLMMALFVVMSIAPFSRWRRTSISSYLHYQWSSLLASLVIVVSLVALFAREFSIAVVFIDTLALWIVINLVRDGWGKVANKKDRVRSLFRQTPSYYGMWIAHVGIAVATIGVCMTVYYSEERDVRMAPGDTEEMVGYNFTLENLKKVEGPNYLADQGRVSVSRSGKHVVDLYPEKRRYQASGEVMTEAAIDPSLARDLYVSLGEPVGSGGAWAVRLHYKPFIRWIWFGGGLIAIGGFVTVLDKRYRAVRRAAEMPKTTAEVAT